MVSQKIFKTPAKTQQKPGMIAMLVMNESIIRKAKNHYSFKNAVFQVGHAFASIPTPGDLRKRQAEKRMEKANAKLLRVLEGTGLDLMVRNNTVQNSGVNSAVQFVLRAYAAYGPSKKEMLMEDALSSFNSAMNGIEAGIRTMPDGAGKRAAHAEAAIFYSGMAEILLHDFNGVYSNIRMDAPLFAKKAVDHCKAAANGVFSESIASAESRMKRINRIMLD